MEEPKSKSQKKREAEALQALGVNLSKLNHTQLEAMNLPIKLFNALLEMQQLKSNGAKRRHAQFLGRLMREIDATPIQDAYDAISLGTAKANAEFHLVERWRARLIEEGKPALTEFLSLYTEVDSQALRHLIKQCIKEQSLDKNLGHSKALFRFIREVLS